MAKRQASLDDFSFTPKSKRRPKNNRSPASDSDSENEEMPGVPVDLQRNDQEKQEMERKRKILCSIVKTILFCGRENFPLQGDREEQGIVDHDEETSDGNFRALLRFRADAGDNILDQANASYVSPRVQNDLISECGRIIKEDIFRRAREAKYFSVLVDKATDVRKNEILCVSIRFISPEEFEPSEYCVGFVHVSDMTGNERAEAIGKIILPDSGLTMAGQVGLAFDGASPMNGEVKSVQARLRTDDHMAVYTHCASQSLILALYSASAVCHIRSCYHRTKKICDFLDSSLKWTAMLRETVESNHPNLIRFCRTRLVERYDAVQIFFELFVPIYVTLRKIEQSVLGDEQISVQDMANAMERLEFAFSLSLLHKTSSHLTLISKNLQLEKVDLIRCCREVAYFRTSLTGWLKDPDFFDEVFNEALAELDKIVGLANVPESGQERRDFCKKRIYNPHFQDLDENLEQRFSSVHEQVYSLQYLLPAFFGDDDHQVIEAFRYYCDKEVEELDSTEGTFLAEYRRWKDSFATMERDELPENASDALAHCARVGQIWYPNIHVLLKILGTLPVTLQPMMNLVSRQ